MKVNNDYRAVLTEHGLRLSGLSPPDGRIVEMCELTEHPFFVATQGHPELKSDPTDPIRCLRDSWKRLWRISTGNKLRVTSHAK